MDQKLNLHKKKNKKDFKIDNNLIKQVKKSLDDIKHRRFFEV